MSDHKQTEGSPEEDAADYPAGSFRNAAVNSSLHAHTIHIGDRTVIRQARREIGRLLTPPPFVPEVFVGREALLDRLRALLVAPNQRKAVLINGEGGIGKSSAAATYYHRFAGEYDHVGWLFLDGDLGETLLRLAPGLNVVFTSDEKDREAMLDRVLLALANLGGRCLLVLDNANDHADLGNHLHRLLGLSNSHLILTSRLAEFPGADTLAVDALEEPAAAALFARRYRALTAEESDLFSAVYAAVGGNTLVLELLAKNLKRVNALRPSLYLLSDLVEDLRSKGIFGLQRSKAVSTQYGGRLQRAEVGSIVSAMYELDTLGAEELYVLAVLSALPADRIPFEHLELLAAGLQELEDPLLNLAARGWVEWQRDEGHFRCSPVVQEIIRTQRPLTIAELRTIAAVFISVLDANNVSRSSAAEVAPFARYLESMNVLPALAADQYSLLCERLGDFYTAVGDLEQAGTVFKRGYAVLRKFWEEKRKPEHTFFLASIFQKNGWVNYLKGDRRRALHQTGNAVEILEGLYTINPGAELIIEQLAICYETESRCFKHDLDWAKAIDRLLKSVALAERLLEISPKDTANVQLLGSLNLNLGGAYYEAGQREKMEAPYRRAYRVFEESVVKNPDDPDMLHSLSIAYEGVALVNRTKKEYAVAEKFLRKRLEITGRLAAADATNFEVRLNAAQAYTGLGRGLQDTRDFPESLGVLKEGLDHAQKLVDDWPEYPRALEWRIHAMLEYGRILHITDGRQEAVDCYLEGIERCEALIQQVPDGLNHQKLLAMLHAQLGHALTHEKTKRKHFRIAARLYETLLEVLPEDGEIQGLLAWVEEKLAAL